MGSEGRGPLPGALSDRRRRHHPELISRAIALRKTASVGRQALLNADNSVAATRTISISSRDGLRCPASGELWRDTRRNRHVRGRKWHVNDEDAAFIGFIANVNVPAVCPDGLLGNR